MTSELKSMLDTMSMAELAKYPAGTPPAGQTSNLVDPPSIAYLFLIVGSVVMSIMYITMGLSLYAKIFVRKRMAPDDWARLISMIGATCYFITCVFAATKAKFGTHMWDLSLAHVLSDPFIITSFFSNWLTAIVWPVVKTSFFLMYLDLFRTIRWQRYAIYFGLALNWGFYLAVVIVTLYYISPAPGQSWQDSFVSARYNGSLNISIPIAAGSLFLDLYILVLPMAPIWNLQLKTSKKWGVTAVFASGLIACIASSLSIYYKVILYNHYTDFSFYTLKVFIMCIVEMCVGITASCMPSIALFFSHHSPQISGFWFRLTHPSLSSRSTQKSYNQEASIIRTDQYEVYSSDVWPLKKLSGEEDVDRTSGATTLHPDDRV